MTDLSLYVPVLHNELYEATWPQVYKLRSTLEKHYELEGETRLEASISTVTWMNQASRSISDAAIAASPRSVMTEADIIKRFAETFPQGSDYMNFPLSEGYKMFRAAYQDFIDAGWIVLGGE